MKMRVRSLRGFFPCLLLVGTSVSSDSLCAQVFVDTRFDGRATVLNLIGGRYYVEAPLGLEPATDLQGRIQYSFVHTGYTEPDVDGQTALLSATVQFRKRGLEPSEIAELAKEGLLPGAPEYKMASGNSLELDVRLPADPAEETRLRKALQLPRTVLAGAKFPLQIKWTGVAGATLYHWLTAPQGLHFNIRYVANLHGDVTVQETLPEPTRRAWWQAKFGAVDRVSLEEGSLAMALDVLAYAQALSGGSSAKMISSADYETINRARRLIDLASSSAGGSTKVLLKDKFLAPKLDEKEVTFEYRLSPTVLHSPGRILTQYPELVTDMSGIGIGLEALLGAK